MADETAIQFGVVEANGFGSFAGWKSGDLSASMNKDRGTAEDEMGNEVNSKLFNERTNYTQNYTCNNDTNTPAGTIGKLEGVAIVTGINFQTNNKAAATMSLSGHQHATNTHADTLQQAAHSIAVAKWFGAIDFMGGTGAAGSALVSGGVNIVCQHQDVEDGSGDHLVGENFNALITATTVWNGKVTTPAIAGWDVTVKESPENNKGFVTTTVTGVKKLTLA